MGDAGEYWRDVKAFYKGKKDRYNSALENKGFAVIRKSIADCGLDLWEDNANMLAPRWVVTGATKSASYWPTTGRIYDQKHKIDSWEGDWKEVGPTLKKLLN